MAGVNFLFPIVTKGTSFLAVCYLCLLCACSVKAQAGGDKPTFQSSKDNWIANKDKCDYPDPSLYSTVGSALQKCQTVDDKVNVMTENEMFLSELCQKIYGFSKIICGASSEARSKYSKTLLELDYTNVDVCAYGSMLRSNEEIINSKQMDFFVRCDQFCGDDQDVMPLCKLLISTLCQYLKLGNKPVCDVRHTVPSVDGFGTTKVKDSTLSGSGKSPSSVQPAGPAPGSDSDITGTDPEHKNMETKTAASPNKQILPTQPAVQSPSGQIKTEQPMTNTGDQNVEKKTTALPDKKIVPTQPAVQPPPGQHITAQSGTNAGDQNVEKKTTVSPINNNNIVPTQPAVKPPSGQIKTDQPMTNIGDQNVEKKTTALPDTNKKVVPTQPAVQPPPGQHITDQSGTNAGDQNVEKKTTVSPINNKNNIVPTQPAVKPPSNVDFTGDLLGTNTEDQNVEKKTTASPNKKIVQPPAGQGNTDGFRPTDSFMSTPFGSNNGLGLENGNVQGKNEHVSDSEFGSRGNQQLNQGTGVQPSDNKVQVKGDFQTIEENESVPGSGHFFAYFLTAVVICISGYVIFHNKQKIMAFIVEGRSGDGRRRGNGNVQYSKLQSNVEEVMPSLDKATTAKNFVY